MGHIERSALVAFSATQMFALVNDVASYPAFMEGCVGAEVLQRSDDEVVARLDLSKAGISHSFVTRNQLTPPIAMTMALVEGPFKYLHGEWRFQALAADACKVSFTLDFEFKSALIGMVAGQWFESVANQLVDGLVKRAQAIYR